MITKSILKYAVAAALTVGSASALAGNQIILTTESAKGGTLVAFDLVGDGRATGFQFRLVLPKGASASTSGCTSQLVKTHQGFCSFKAGEVRVAGLSMTNAPLPTAMTPVGTVFISGLNAKAVGQIAIRQVEFADATGAALEFSAVVDGAAAQAEKAK